MGKGGDNANGAFLAWGHKVTECEAKLGVSVSDELRSEEATRRRKIYGWNKLEKHSGPSTWDLVVDQFLDTLVCILLVADLLRPCMLRRGGGRAGGEMGVSTFVEPLVIFLILIVNAIVRVWQESNAGKALEALKEIPSEKALVRRDGGRLIVDLPAKELVVRERHDE